MQNLPSTRRLVAHDDALASESRLFLGTTRHPRPARAPSPLAEGAKSMGANLTQYRGWDINATYYSGGNGYLPAVMITKHTATGAIDKQLTPPSAGSGPKTRHAP